mmetsp:Transcript_98730/g.268119  ORF Transcript_98730/g.268119 Transcript_98730/m.268119 type:complete len:304 (+) Transcript_98730:336-1247(+)
MQPLVLTGVIGTPENISCKTLAKGARCRATHTRGNTTSVIAPPALHVCSARRWKFRVHVCSARRYSVGHSTQQDLAALAETLPARHGLEALRGPRRERQHALLGNTPVDCERHPPGLLTDLVVRGALQALGSQGVLRRGVHAPDARGLLGGTPPGAERRDHVALAAHDPLLEDGRGGQLGLHVARRPRRVQPRLRGRLRELAPRLAPRLEVGGRGHPRTAERLGEHPRVRVALRVCAARGSPRRGRWRGRGGGERGGAGSPAAGEAASACGQGQRGGLPEHPTMCRHAWIGPACAGGRGFEKC